MTSLIFQRYRDFFQMNEQINFLSTERRFNWSALLQSNTFIWGLNTESRRSLCVWNETGSHSKTQHFYTVFPKSFTTFQRDNLRNCLTPSSQRFAHPVCWGAQFPGSWEHCCNKLVPQLTRLSLLAPCPCPKISCSFDKILNIPNADSDREMAKYIPDLT